MITGFKLVYVWVFSEEAEVSFLSPVLAGFGRRGRIWNKVLSSGSVDGDALLLWPVILRMLLYLGTALPCGLQDGYSIPCGVVVVEFMQPSGVLSIVLRCDITLCAGWQ